jgi:hypothetical protein
MQRKRIIVIKFHRAFIEEKLIYLIKIIVPYVSSHNPRCPEMLN